MWGAININLPLFSTIKHFRDIFETNFALRPWYDAIQSSIGSGVEANWQSHVFSLRQVGLRSTCKRCRFWQKKIIFEAPFALGGYINKQNYRICGTENLHAYIEKTTHPKHNWAIFLRKCARRGRYNQWRSLSGHVERIFVHKNWRRGYWQHLVSTGRRYIPHSQNYTRSLAPCFWRSQSWCRLTTSELRFNSVGLLFGESRQR